MIVAIFDAMEAATLGGHRNEKKTNNGGNVMPITDFEQLTIHRIATFIREKAAAYGASDDDIALGIDVALAHHRRGKCPGHCKTVGLNVAIASEARRRTRSPDRRRARLIESMRDQIARRTGRYFLLDDFRIVRGRWTVCGELVSDLLVGQHEVTA